MLDLAKLRAWWSHRQGLDGSLAGKSSAEVLERSGWARSVGGVGPYLTLFARAGIGRQAADAAIAKLQIHELPAARGCTYVVPASQFALALLVGQSFAAAEMKTASKLGVTQQEIDRLCKAVRQALARGPLDPDGIRTATGSASRSLGEAGKKRGLSTTLPVALGLLQAQGHIRRVPMNGRLDQQRFRYALWKPNPLEAGRGSLDDAYRALAVRFFRWVGPARLAEFQWFSGLGVKAAAKVVEPLGLAPIDAQGDRLLLPDDLEAFRAFKVPAKPQYTFVSSLDAIAATRREIDSLLDPSDRTRKVQVDRQIGPLGGFYDLPHHAILDRGRLIGLWEYDPEAGSLVWASFTPPDKALVAAATRTGAFVRDELGDARSFSLDSPTSRAPRIAALRRLAGRAS